MLSTAMLGCSTLPNQHTVSADDESGLVDLEEYDGAGIGEPAAGQPRHEDVAWEDNGHPIRALTPEGKPYEMKVPQNEVQRKGQIVDLEAEAEAAKKDKKKAKKK
jgi:hypothetical protein